MNTAVIQYGQLEELVSELTHGNLVRVVILDISKSISSQIPDWRQVDTGVHIRTINESGHILACYLPVASIQLFNGRRDSDPTWQKYDSAWEQADALKERVFGTLRTIAT